MRLVLCDEHLLFSEVLASALAARGHEIVAVAASALDGIRAVADLAPDACILDTRFRDADGLDAVRAIRRANDGTQMLLLSAEIAPETVSEALALGVRGVLLKEQGVDAVLEALGRLGRGQLAVAPARQSRTRTGAAGGPAEVVHSLRRLTPREREVLRILVSGASTATIADTLGISPNTARAHVQNVYVKLGTHSRLELAALVAGFLDER